METRAPTYEDYLAAGRGELSAEEFKAALPHATAAVRDLIFPNEPDGSEEWARAVMAACEVDAAYGCSGGIMEGGGFTVGSFSWNPGTEGASTYRSDMEAAVRRELLGTPLLYEGLVIADGADSPGMFDVPVGSRVSIDGGEWMNVARCTPRHAFGTRPHHWELEVR